MIEEHQKELQDYKTAKATVQFPLDQELPIALIKKLIEARILKNQENKG